MTSPKRPKVTPHLGSLAVEHKIIRLEAIAQNKPGRAATPKVPTSQTKGVPSFQTSCNLALSQKLSSMNHHRAATLDDNCYWMSKHVETWVFHLGTAFAPKSPSSTC